MKPPEFYHLSNIALTILGIILLLSTLFTGKNMLSTYLEVEHSKQDSIWSIIQLDKEMEHMYFKTEQYLQNQVTKKELTLGYDILWSRVPLALNCINNDKTFTLIDADGLKELVPSIFNHIKSIDALMSTPDEVNPTLLKQWSVDPKALEKKLSANLIHNIASSNSEYSKTTLNKIIKAALLMLASVMCFILYLCYLLLELWSERQRSQHLLNHDSLTRLYSRDFTMSIVERYCAEEIPFTLLSFDLNKFKSVNDTLGHHAGDKVLQFLGEKFNATLGQKGILGRVGGDEFLWIIKSTDEDVIHHYYQEFLDTLKEPVMIDQQPILLKLSAGAGLASSCQFHPASLLEHVDQAMYKSKQLKTREIYWGNNKLKTTTKSSTPLKVALHA